MFKPWLLSNAEQNSQQLANNTHNSLVDIFEQSFSHFAEHCAFINMDKSITFAELDISSRSIATYLQQDLKLKQGDRVAVMMPNLIQYPIVLLGILRAGLTVVNVNPLYTAPELKHQLKDSGAKAIFIVSNFAKTLQEIVNQTDVKHVVLSGIGDELTLIKRNLVNFIIKYVKRMVPKYKLPGAHSYRDVLKMGEQGQYIRPVINPDEIAFIQYTGGTTGVSKGAMLSHHNMVSSLNQAEGVFGNIIQRGDETIVTSLPLYHAFALTVNCLYFIKIGGRNILVTNPRDIPAFIGVLKKYRFGYFTGLNTLFNALMNHPDFDQIDFSSLKITLAGGMATNSSVASRWKKLTGCAVIEGYGLTECAPMVSVNPANTTDHNGSIGYPMPGTDIRLIDENNQVVEAVNLAGEIEIRGPQVMKGYWNNEAETKAAIVDGWFKSGDVGLFDEAGFLHIIDRKKDMILVSGFNVYPNEIENVVSALEGVLECAAVGIKDDAAGEKVKLFVVLTDHKLTINDIKAYCKENLTAYKCPKTIEIVTDLPKNNVGKVLRRLLKDR